MSPPKRDLEKAINTGDRLVTAVVFLTQISHDNIWAEWGKQNDWDVVLVISIASCLAWYLIKIMVRDGVKACGLVPTQAKINSTNYLGLTYSKCSNPGSLITSISMTLCSWSSAFTLSHLLLTVTPITFPILQTRKQMQVQWLVQSEEKWKGRK